MKKVFKIAGATIVLTGAVITASVFISNKATANNADYTAVVEEYVAQDETSVYDAVDMIAAEVATVAPTEESTEMVTTTEEATTEEIATVEATTAETTTVAPTEAVTEVPTTTEAVTEAPTTAAVVEVAPPTEENKTTSTFTNVTYKDGHGNTYNYDTLEEAMADIHVATLSESEAKAAAASNKSTYASEATELYNLINAYRKANGLKEVKWSDNLTDAAMERAAESAYADWNMTAYENGSKRHIRPNYTKASTIGAEYGITGNFGENFARFFQSAEATLEGWQNSSAHNALMLSADYTTVGIGVAADSTGSLYWVAIFN